uniref:Uncharacterized protein n=1 Tax=Rhizophagus irregularis (strain DAOM 181602 / DAOM 197198 / MUCL 43194) TaxID=747089 RepID=U9SHD2_RHIID
MKHTNNWLKWEKVHIPTNVRAAKERKRIYYKESSSPLNKYSTQLKDLCKTNIESSNSEIETEIDREIIINMQVFKYLK